MGFTRHHAWVACEIEYGMKLFKLTDVEERLVHELKDIDSIQRVILFNVGRLNEIMGRLEPRIKKFNEDFDEYIKDKKANEA